MPRRDNVEPLPNSHLAPPSWADGLPLEVRRSLVAPTADECALHSPLAALNLYHALWISGAWSDCYTLLTSESKAKASHREFLEVHYAGKMRIEPSAVRVIAPPLIDRGLARFYCEATLSLAYPRVEKTTLRLVRTMVRENDGAWRLQWRKPSEQIDLGQVIRPQLARRRTGVVLRLDSLSLLEGSTMISLRVTNDRPSPVVIGPSRCRLTVAKQSVQLRQSVQPCYGARTCEPGEESGIMTVFEASDPRSTALTFSLALTLGEAEKWSPRFHLSNGRQDGE